VAAGCSLLSLFFIFWFDSVRSRPYNLCLLSPLHVLLLRFVFALFSSLYLVCLSFSGLLETVKKMVMLILISVFSACAFLLFSLSFFLPSPGFSFFLICNLLFFRSLSLFSLGSASSFLLVFPFFFFRHSWLSSLASLSGFFAPLFSPIHPLFPVFFFLRFARFPLFFPSVFSLFFPPFCSSAVLDIYRQENALATPRVIVQPLG
jgi:hypothetical protein